MEKDPRLTSEGLPIVSNEVVNTLDAYMGDKNGDDLLGEWIKDVRERNPAVLEYMRNISMTLGVESDAAQIDENVARFFFDSWNKMALGLYKLLEAQAQVNQLKDVTSGLEEKAR